MSRSTVSSEVYRRFAPREGLPSAYLVEQRMEPAPEVQIERQVAESLDAAIDPSLVQGRRVAIGAGSRGVNNIAIVARQTVEWVKDHGGVPTILPAMGSHGGSTPEGQLATLRGLGITPESVGAPLDASMEVVKLGDAMARPVFWSKVALESDLVLTLSRIKPHTCFHAPRESGITKMIAIGLGKQAGAAPLHSLGDENLGVAIPAFAEVVVRNAPPIFGLALIENSLHQTCHVEVVPSSQLELREPELLDFARQQMPKLNLLAADVLVIDRIGKDVSGDGMDPNVTGRYSNCDIAHDGFSAKRIVVLGLTNSTQGNAHGIGLADFTTHQVVDAIDWDKTLINAFTAGVTSTVKRPVMTSTAAEALDLAVATAGVWDRNAKVVRIVDTMNVGRILVTESLLDEQKSSGARIIGGPYDILAPTTERILS